MINVTKTYLPSLNEYNKYLKKIWQTSYVTNHGPMVVKLEKDLTDYFNIKHLRLVSNGTIGLELAIRSLNLKGNIITTPFSYIASSASIVWQNCKPIFADIDPSSLCISPKEVEKMIDKNTQAILAVHVFGNPCDVDALSKIAKKHNLKVIYDAAHAFGVSYRGRSVLSYGDISVLSFHATKIFHTVEGGAVVSNDPKIDKTVDHLRRFGHKGPYSYYNLGTNAKMSELHAAMGLAILPHFKNVVATRKKIVNKYDSILKNYSVIRITIDPEVKQNYSYYPIILSSQSQLKKVVKNLNTKDIFPRRYFYPSLNTLTFFKSNKCMVSEDISRRVLCLPLSYDLCDKDIEKITNTIIKSI